MKKSSLALGRDRSARYDCVVAATGEDIEAPIEVVAGVFYRAMGQPEIVTDRPHELDVEPGFGAVDGDLERRIGEGRGDS